MAPNCEKCGAPMVVLSRFKFDHEPTDSDRDKESLRMFKAMGVELGADVTLWYCAPCDFAQADFAYPDTPGRGGR
jgi:hypothetical protein